MTSRQERVTKDLLSCEIGSCRKKWKGKLPLALIFPNSYQLGMSNLGFQLVYALLNKNSDIVCERFFLSRGATPLSIESNRPLRDFPILLASVSFEHDFLGLLELLCLAGIEPLAEKRLRKGGRAEPGNPLLAAGGVATFIDPEPLAPFVDFFLLGEAEPVIDQLISYLFEFAYGGLRDELLSSMARSVRGCYVPALYGPIYFEDGRLSSIEAKQGAIYPVKTNISPAYEGAGHSQILSSEAEFSNVHLVELGRGCSRSCRFCAAGYVYRPPRLWSAEAIIEAIRARPQASRKVGLLGMEMANQADLQKVAAFLLAEECSLSFSSLRADALGPSLLELLGSSDIKSAAIAPDGPSARLRQVINKGISADDCLHAAESLVRAGVRNLKLYFMIGLPTEDTDDLFEMVELVAMVQKKILEVGRARGRLSSITLSINSFVPKAWTPLQFHGLAPLKELKAKVKFLRKQFAGFNNLKLQFDHPDKAFFQAMLSRGDRRVGEVLLKVSRSKKNWRQVYKANGVDPSFYAMRLRDKSELFPWEIVDHGLKRRYLWEEYQRALQARPSTGCEIASGVECVKCGACRGQKTEVRRQKTEDRS